MWWSLLLSVTIMSPGLRALTENGIDVVNCREGKESCECDRTAKICHFTLKIRELQTFTSYKFEEERSEEDILGPPGDTYYLTNTGFNPSLLPPRNDSTSAKYRRACWKNNVKNIQEFILINCTVPMTVDGHTYRPYIAVNGRSPGPTLIVGEGQRVRVNVHNFLREEGITIHWHGLAQQGTPWMDGVGYLSQSPIQPEKSFEYEFMAQPTGTHWYHSHTGAQRMDGLYGAFIVREKNSTFESVKGEIGTFEDAPNSHTLILLDFQKERYQTVLNRVRSRLGFYCDKPLSTHAPTQNDSESLETAETLTTDPTTVGSIPYWSGLINGLGRHNSNTHSLLSVFKVKPNTAYRFRLIGAQGHYVYRVEIIGHKMTVIATDGYFIRPTEVDYIIIHTGERYDFILNATQTRNNYLIRAQTLEVANPNNIHVNPNDYKFADHFAEAILHYDSPSVTKPDPTSHYANVVMDRRQCTQKNRCRAINCPHKEFPSSLNINCVHLNQLQALFPSNDDDLPSLRINENCKDCLHYFNFGFLPNSLAATINGRVFKPPSIPYQAYPGSYELQHKNNHNDFCDSCRSENNTITSCNGTCINVVTVADGKTYTKGKEETVMMVLSAVGWNGYNKRADFSHSVHLHGHSFYVVHVGYGQYQNGRLIANTPDVQCDQPYCLSPNWRNGTQSDFSKYSKTGKIHRLAIRKDTVTVPAGGYVVIAFKADNPGYWFLHCQIERHHLDGMALILQEYPESQHPPLPLELMKKVTPYWNRQEKISLGLTVGLALLNLVLGLATGLISMSFIYRKCIRGERNLLKKGKRLLHKTHPNNSHDDDAGGDREGEQLLEKQQSQNK
jgi:FtsP/CotA-like multicopper oxidase with cupredoxin domain